MLRNISIFCSIFFLLVNVSSADENKVKIATIDMVRVENNSYISKDLVKKMSAKESEIQQELLKRKNKLESEFKSLESKRSILSAEELQKKARKLENDYQQFQIDGNFYGKVLDKARMNALVIVHNNIKKAANIVANGKNGYDLIITLDSAIYINQNKFDDVTEKTIEAINKISKTIDYETAYKNAKSEISELLKDAKK